MKYLFPSVIVIVCLHLGACVTTQPVLRVGLVADPQYADQPTAGKRYYRESVWKLQQAVDTFNYHRVNFVQTLGDVIDTNWASYDSILPVYNNLDAGIANYHALGNHDFSIDSIHMPQLLDRLGMPGYYYSYARKGYRFIVLDATDYAFYSNSLHNYPAANIERYFESTLGQSNHQRWNSAVGPEQLAWLRQELASAETAKEKVILFSHTPLRPEGGAHNLWNAPEIAAIIEASPSVVAFINGHNHAGDYAFENGIHYLTIFGMVDTETSSYAILEIFKDRLVLKGYGNQKSMVLR